MAKNLIPRKLHYVWMGRGEKPDKIKYCMESWHKHLKGWEIIEWNEDNFPLNKYPFALKAYRRKRWAFVSDVARLYALYTEGGVFVDADVEIVKSLDRFLAHRAFTGHETQQLTLAAVMGAEKRHPWIEYLLKYYDNRPYDETPNTQIVSRLNKPLIERQDKYGYTYLRDGVVIYPVEYFASFDHKRLKVIHHPNAYAYHHFAGSWTGRQQ